MCEYIHVSSRLWLLRQRPAGEGLKSKPKHSFEVHRNILDPWQQLLHQPVPRRLDKQRAI